MANLLAGETSPYLLQHADNPVEWRPWNAAALEAARALDRPILLSIGYAACHWCHVMAHESFENAETARLMNDRFVNIKVDREERPDLDGIYMQAVQALTGQGGWPMTVFLTPTGEPFYGGTYFPPADRHGLPGFRRILLSVSDAWATNRGEVERATASLRAIYADRNTSASTSTLDANWLDAAYRGMARRFEPQFGGFGGAPKFPHAMALDAVLRHWARTGDAHALHMVRHSFVQMARAGVYDQVGGGFHRYAVDAQWLVPHFEKMLYDNALLVRLGVHLWQATGDLEVRRVVGETLAWLSREMTDASGGWYSSLDADSEGEEGKFYVWSLAEFRAALGAATAGGALAGDASWAEAYFGVTRGGNFEGHNILTARADLSEAAIAHDTPAAVPMPSPNALGEAKRALLAARGERVRPGRDEKILASWNGLMLRAVAEAARVLEVPEYRAAAVANGEFLWREMVRNGRGFRTHTRGVSRIAGFLEDHAAVALGFVALYQLTFDRTWLDRARVLADSCVTWFWSEGGQRFFDTATDHEALVTRPRDISDNATPSGISLATELMLLMAELLGDEGARAHALTELASLAEPATQYGVMFGHVLGAGDLAVHGAIEVAIAGTPGTPAFDALAHVAAQAYLPSLVLVGGSGDDVRGMPLFEGRQHAAGATTAYVCRGYSCDAPTNDPAVLRAQLARAARS